jgi:hypothetical protein
LHFAIAQSTYRVQEVKEKECNSSATAAAKTDLYKILGLHRQKMMICVENAKDRERLVRELTTRRQCNNKELVAKV